MWFSTNPGRLIVRFSPDLSPLDLPFSSGRRPPVGDCRISHQHTAGNLLFFCDPKPFLQPCAGLDHPHKIATVEDSRPFCNRHILNVRRRKPADKAVEATRKALDGGAAPQEIINGQMIRAMGEVGQRFQDGKAFVPQLLMAGRAMKAALELLKPMLAGSASTTIGRVVIGTVKGDLHDIGKNLVASMLEGSGFEVDNIGIDVPSDKFVEAVKAYHADILCMSALLTTTMTYMKDVIKAIDDAGLRGKVKIMVGGAPVSQAFADEIGADGYSDNANEAVKVAKALMQSGNSSTAERG